jgi:hypothetical protein
MAQQATPASRCDLADRRGAAMADPSDDSTRCVHYVGFRDDRYWNAYRIFGGPRVIHRRWDFYATRDVGPGDVVIFAEGDADQPVAARNATDLDERWL